MRINVYGEELTADAGIVTKTADTGITFYGIRLFLKSAPELHDLPSDDDRSAITLWIPWTKAGSHDFGAMKTALYEMLNCLSECERKDRLHYKQIAHSMGVPRGQDRA